MRSEIKILTIILILGMAVALSCGGGNVDQLKEVEETVKSGTSKAVSGDVIKTAEEAGKTGEESGEEGEEGEEGETPAEGEGEGEEGSGGGEFLPPGMQPELPPVEPIKGKIKMDDLTYPTFNPATGSYEKPKAGDSPAYTQMTSDPFFIVVGYYDQILKGRDVDAKNNIGESGPMWARYIVKDSGNTFTVSINNQSDTKSTVISITKG